MCRRVTHEKIIAIAQRIMASKKFSRYKRENESMSMAFEITKDPVQKKLAEMFRSIGELPCWKYQEIYKAMEERFSDYTDYTAADIERFSIALEAFQGDKEFPTKAAVFLSFLINNGTESDYFIHTSSYRDLDFLGCLNTKNIMVNGNAGHHLGISMKEGRITVLGDSGVGTGYHMKGGMIEVHGNAGPSAGEDMKNGVLIIHGDAGPFLAMRAHDSRIHIIGNAGRETGKWMARTEIHISGNHKGISKKIISGRIYHKGELILEKEGGHYEKGHTIQKKSSE